MNCWLLNKIKLFLPTVLFILTSCSSGRVPDMEDYALAEELIDKGVIYLRSGEIKKAWSSFSLSREIVDSPAAIDGLGCVAMEEEDPVLAEKYFLMAFEMDNTYYNALGNLALLYELEGYHKKSKKLYEEVLAEIPDDFRFRNNYGALMAESYNDEEAELIAEKEFRQATMLQDNSVTDNNLEKLTGDRQDG